MTEHHIDIYPTPSGAIMTVADLGPEDRAVPARPLALGTGWNVLFTTACGPPRTATI